MLGRILCALIFIVIISVAYRSDNNTVRKQDKSVHIDIRMIIRSVTSTDI